MESASCGADFIEIWFDISDRLRIFCAKFCEQMFREYDATEGQHSAFPIDFGWLRYNSSTAKLLWFFSGNRNTSL